MRHVSGLENAVVRPTNRFVLVRIVVALSLVVGMLTGVFSALLANAASAATPTVSLAMTAGTFATRGGTPTPLPVAATAGFAGKESEFGTLSTGTLKVPTQHEAHTGSKETILVYQKTGTEATGTITTTGQVTIAATLFYEVHITAPVTTVCTTVTAVHVVLSSNTPYDSSTKSVTVANAGITVPFFASCIAATELDTTFSGAGGELGLTLVGTLAVPPPAAATTTVVSASPASPQLVGTSLTLKATVKKTTGAAATTATGSMTFTNGSTTLGVASVTGGTASLVTKALPVGTDSVVAVYGGGDGYKASTSAPLPYVVKAAPTVQVSGLAPSVTGGTTTEHTFTVTLTDPANGVAFSQAYVELSLVGVRAAASVAKLQFEDSAGAWCTPLDFRSATTVLAGYIAQVGTACTPATFPASFPLTPGVPVVLNLRISYPKIAGGLGLYGVNNMTATLFTGTCTSKTKCTAAAPLSSTSAPKGVESQAILPASPIPSASTLFNGRQKQTDIRQTFSVGLESQVRPAATQTASILPAPTGTVAYSIDSVSATTTPIDSASGAVGRTNLFPYGRAGLALGPHHVTATYTPATYTGVAIYQSSSYSFTFTVTPAPTGTPFSCRVSGVDTGTVLAYVTATGTLPVATLATSTTTVTASDVSVSATFDPDLGAIFYKNVTTPVLGFSPTDTLATAPSDIFTGTTTVSTAVTGTLSGLSTSVNVAAGTAPGTVVDVGVESIALSASLIAWTCVLATASVPAPVGSTEVAGTKLSESRTSVKVGKPATFTASVFPKPTATSAPSTVTFSAGSADLGTASVQDTGPTAGKATLTETTLAAGDYTVVARWSGNGTSTVPANTSNPVSLHVLPVPTVTGISPNAGPVAGGTTVTITGTGLTTTNAVFFGSAQATGVTVKSGTQVTATAPSAPGGVPGTAGVVVSTTGGTSTAAPSTSYSWDGLPAVTSLSRTSGPVAGGTKVTITGSNFSTVKSVKFGTTPAAAFSSTSSTSMSATAPAHTAGTVTISVTTPGGTSTATSHASYRFIPSVPAVSGISPASGTPSGGTTVTVSGSGFTGATKVSFGSTTGTAVVVNAAGTQLTVRSPAGTAGSPVNVQVATPGGESPVSTADLFTYGPTITSLSRSSGPVTGGTKVTITGTGFSTVAHVRFGTSTATFTVSSATSVIATAPAHAAGPVRVSVVTAAGTTPATGADLYTY